MDINKKLKELEEEIDDLKAAQHNHGMIGAANRIQKSLKREATVPELRFKDVAEKMGLNLKFQQKIDIFNGKRIKKFYFPDFIDRKNKIIFEVDGGYHFTEEQRKKDYKRTRDLNKAGYKVFRITNEEVMSGGTSAFLYKCYLSIGINLIEEKKKSIKWNKDKYGV